MISQRGGKCRGESENTPGSSKETPSSVDPWLSQVGTPNFKILQILALARRPNVLLPMSQPSIASFLIPLESRRVFELLYLSLIQSVPP